MRTPVKLPMAPLKVRILYADSGLGLAMDAQLLRAVLESMNCRVAITATVPWTLSQTVWSHRIAGIKTRLPASWVAWFEHQQVQWLGRGKSQVDLQIHLESPEVEYLAAGRTNWLIPNQEWLRPQHLGFLSMFDRVLVKTHEGARQLASVHPRVEFLGFSNPIAEQAPVAGQQAVAAEQQVTSAKKRFRRFLHIAGKNRKKGTGAIIAAWRRHPEWPQLDLVSDESVLSEIVLDEVALNDMSVLDDLPDNVVHWSRPERATLQRLHRECGIVLAPSEVEGFGHILVESMAQQNVVVTTDAAPMNEIITPEYGYLVPWDRQQPCHFGTRYFVAVSAIEAVVSQLLTTEPECLLAQSLTAQQWVKCNHAAFIDRLSRQVEEYREALYRDALYRGVLYRDVLYIGEPLDMARSEPQQADHAAPTESQHG